MQSNTNHNDEEEVDQSRSEEDVGDSVEFLGYLLREDVWGEHIFTRDGGCRGRHHVVVVRDNAWFGCL